VGGWSVGELLGAAVECSARQQLEIEVRRSIEDWLRAGASADHREDRELDPVYQTGGHESSVEGQASVRAQGHSRRFLQPRDDINGIALLKRGVWPVERCGMSVSIDYLVP